MTYFQPWVNRILVAVGLSAFVALEVHHVTVVHELRRVKGTVCLAQLEALRARTLFTERYLLPADPCLALSVIAETSR